MDIRQEHLAMKKGKRFRSAFTTEQVNYLEKEFRKFPYIGNAHRKEVANVLNIPERAVKIWFQNRRMKEKKDAVSKDQDFGDRNNYKNVDFTNDKSNNMRPRSSVNEQNPLPLLTTFKDAPNKLNIVTTEAFTQGTNPEASKRNFYKDISPNQDQVPMTNASYRTPPPVIINNTVSTSPYKSSAEFSIDLCKKYKNDLLNNTEVQKKPILESETVQPMELIKQHTPKAEFKYNPGSVPEDLSYNKFNYRPQSESPPKNMSPNLGFQPVYVSNYPQPYMPAGNMLWKPVNIMPIMSTGASAVTISSNLSGSLSVSQNQSAPKKPCTCDCHVVTPAPVNYAETNPNPHAQYIITAVPFQNYPKF